MANLTADSKINFAGPSPRQTYSYIITNGLQLYVGSIVQLTSGYIAKQVTGKLIQGVAIAGGVPGSNQVIDGYNLQSLPIPSIAPGNVSTAPSGAANRVIVEQGAFIWSQVTLTLANGTLAGTVADVGTKVYAGNTDNVADVTNTQPGTDKPLGTISRFYSVATTTAIYDIDVLDHESRSRGN